MTDAVASEVEFIDTCGTLPPMWPRRAIFFANLLALFYGNSAQTESLRQEVGEIDSYSARLIPIMNLLFREPGNMLVLEREPDPKLCQYLREDLGLSLPRMCVLPHDDYVRLGEGLDSAGLPLASLPGDLLPQLVQLKDAAAQWVDGYVTDEVITKFARHLGCQTISSSDASRHGNNKLRLHEFLVSAELPAFDTVIVKSPGEVPQAAEELAALGYREAVIRAQIGASGIGMMRLRDIRQADQLPEIPEYIFYEGPCLLQGWLQSGVRKILEVRSPSTQLFVDDTHVYAYDVTEQILSNDSIHQGNASPPPYFQEWPGLREETMRQADLVGRWLHGTGYRGTASIDWLVTQREDQPQPDVYVCEINARVTGATYPSLLARHFHPQGAWLMRNLRLRVPLTTEQLLAMFEQPGHLFHPHKSAGILPLNLNFGKDNLVHKGQFLCIGQTLQECQEYLALAERDLPVEWDADRD